MISNYGFDPAKDGRISDVLIETSRFSRILKDTTSSENIAITDFQILLLLMDRGPLSVSQLSNLLCKAGSNMVPAVKKLESAGYAYSTNTADARIKRVVITQKGLEYAVYLIEKARQRHDKLFKYSL